MFEQIVVKTVRRLSEAKRKDLLADFGLIGGLAVSRWGIPRATVDIDFFFAPGAADLNALAKFLGGKLRKGALDDPLLATISFEEKDKHGRIPIQLIQFPPAFETVARDGIQYDKLDGASIPIVDWKALVLLKLYAGSSLDLEDARNILKVVAPSKSDLKKLQTRATALRLSKRLGRVMGNESE